MHAFSDAFEESLAIQGTASALGFDWPDVYGVLDKVQEELDEIREALGQDDAAHAQRELGDLLLATVNLSRFLGMHPGEALHVANTRFEARFSCVKFLLAGQGKRAEECTLEELDAVWDQVKALPPQEVAKVLDRGRIHEANSSLPSGADLKICP